MFFVTESDPLYIMNSFAILGESIVFLKIIINYKLILCVSLYTLIILIYYTIDLLFR